MQFHIWNSLTYVLLLQVILHNKAYISGNTWDNFKPAPHVDLRYVSYELQNLIMKTGDTIIDFLLTC